MYVKVVVAKPLYQRFTYSFDPQELPIEVGMRLIVPFGTREITAFAVEVCDTIEKTQYAIKEVKKVVDDVAIFTSYHIQLAIWMSKLYLCSEGEALSAMIPSNKREVSEELFPDVSFISDSVKTDQLTEEQKGAIEAIYHSPEKLHYLYGVTGSGKTEVFFHLAEKIIQEKKEVIYLVPEISLTYQ
jgi:primosomal protein N' (replication factor Y)